MRMAETISLLRQATTLTEALELCKERDDHNGNSSPQSESRFDGTVLRFPIERVGLSK